LERAGQCAHSRHGVAQNRRLVSARRILLGRFPRFGYPHCPLTKSAAEPKVYLQSQGGDFDFAKYVGCFGRRADAHSIEARGNRRVHAISDSMRLFKRLRSA